MVENSIFYNKIYKCLIFIKYFISYLPNTQPTHGKKLKIQVKLKFHLKSILIEISIYLTFNSYFGIETLVKNLEFILK